MTGTEILPKEEVVAPREKRGKGTAKTAIWGKDLQKSQTEYITAGQDMNLNQLDPNLVLKKEGAKKVEEGGVSALWGEK